MLLLMKAKPEVCRPTLRHVNFRNLIYVIRIRFAMRQPRFYNIPLENLREYAAQKVARSCPIRARRLLCGSAVDLIFLGYKVLFCVFLGPISCPPLLPVRYKKKGREKRKRKERRVSAPSRPQRARVLESGNGCGGGGYAAEKVARSCLLHREATPAPDTAGFLFCFLLIGHTRYSKVPDTRNQLLFAIPKLELLCCAEICRHPMFLLADKR